ncbi:hypothetical protein HDU98_007461 [Podochytrium sp. JEL0797]|nr:hypothetical protein HDU98_007461 [Podochytrium sp. JEL0797]
MIITPEIPALHDADAAHDHGDLNSDEEGFSVGKPKRKPGRKTILDAPQDKRVAQNRQAQRAFRERKEAYLNGLESLVKEQEVRIVELKAQNSLLERENAVLQQVTGSVGSRPHASPSPLEDLFGLGPQRQQQNVPLISPVATQRHSLPVVPKRSPTQNSTSACPIAQYRAPSASVSSNSSPGVDVAAAPLHATGQDLFSLLSEASQSTPLLQPPLSRIPSIIEPSLVVPVYKAQSDILESQIDSILTPLFVRAPQTALCNAALKKLPSLRDDAVVDEFCDRFVRLTTKCGFRGLPHPDSAPIVDEEHRQLVLCIARVQAACGDPEDAGKAREIIEVGVRRNREHYERLVAMSRFNGGSMEK